MDDPKDDSTGTDSLHMNGSESVSHETDGGDERAQREDRVRRKLQQLFGDDSPATVRHFLSDLARDGAEDNAPFLLRPDDGQDSEPN